jgi:hypothetical protein
MSNYNLIAYIPYEKPDYLFSGSEADLKDFINRNRGEKHTYTTASGKKWFSKVVCGYMLDDLEVSIDGPDVESYLD